MPLRFRVLPTDDTPSGGAAAPAGPLLEREVELPGAASQIRIGRRGDVELSLPFAALSGVHARLSRAGEGWLVEDAGSTNGTWLDGARLPPGERRALEPGAELRLGNVRVRFEGAAVTAPAAAGTATLARRLVDDLFGAAGQGDPKIGVISGAPLRALALAALGREYLVGRAETCALRLPVEEVSREHAAFMRGEAGVFVRDLGSKNGVVVNGARVAGEHLLADGDVVTIGPVTLGFVDPVSRYLAELALLPAEPYPAAAERFETRDGEPLLPPQPGPARMTTSGRRAIGSTQIAAGVAISVLALLALVAVVVFWPAR